MKCKFPNGSDSVEHPLVCKSDDISDSSLLISLDSSNKSSSRKSNAWTVGGVSSQKENTSWLEPEISPESSNLDSSLSDSVKRSV